MNNCSGTLPFIKPIEPWTYNCYYCGNPAAGYHGTFYDHKEYWVCKNCYSNVLAMREPGQPHIQDTWKDTVLYVGG